MSSIKTDDNIEVITNEEVVSYESWMIHLKRQIYL